MAEEQGLSAENRALIERLFNCKLSDPHPGGVHSLKISHAPLNRLLDAARSEGHAKPQGDVSEDSGLAAADDNHKALVEAARKVLAEHEVRYGICNDDNAWHDLHRALAPFTKETDHGED